MSDQPRTPRTSRRTKIIIIAAIVLVVSAVSTALTWNLRDPFDSGAPRDASTQSALDGLVDEGGFPAALAAVTAADGRTTDYTAGVAELGTDKPVPADGLVRIGSNTKMYTAVVVLQLVDDGLVQLDEPVESYLPGLLGRYGIDGSTITVRQLLQHTSGLPNYTTALAATLFTPGDQYMDAREQLDIAFSLPVSFAPGERWEYSNTNYILAGLLAEKVARQPIAKLITERIIEPLGLRDTSYPVPGDLSIPGPHPLGYHAGDDGQLRDITDFDPSLGGAAGQMIASPSDVNRFMRALLGGELLTDATLEQMMTTVPADDLWPGSAYGLGLESFPLTCDALAWGHGGDIPGYETRNATIPGGATATVAVTALPGGLTTVEDEAIGLATDVYAALDKALCAAG